MGTGICVLLGIMAALITRSTLEKKKISVYAALTIGMLSGLAGPLVGTMIGFGDWLAVNLYQIIISIVII